MSSLPIEYDNRQTFKVQRWIVAVGILLLVLKFTAYFITNSVAILTDALESIVNVSAGIVTLYSLYIAAKPRDENHPYGHGKIEFLSAGIEGTLITIAGIWILIEAVRKLIYAQPVRALSLGIVLIGISGLVNFIAGSIAIKTGTRNHSLAITATGKHLKSDSYSTIGLLVGLLLLKYTGLSWLDSAIAILMAIIIIYTGISIIRQSVAGIMDEADQQLLGRMVKSLNEHRTENWIDLHNLRVIKYGSSMHIDCHLTIPWYFTVTEANLEVERLDNLIRAELGTNIELFTHTDGCLPASCGICEKANCEVRATPFQTKVNWTIRNIFENKKHTRDTN